MAEETKKSAMGHEHPIYPWIALVFSVVAILGVAGWYYLTYQTTVDADALVSIQATYQPAKGESNSTSAVNAKKTDIQAEVDKIDASANAVSSDSTDSAQLGNTTLGVQ